jgi:hypothetical protein
MHLDLERKYVYAIGQVFHVLEMGTSDHPSQSLDIEYNYPWKIHANHIFVPAPLAALTFPHLTLLAWPTRAIKNAAVLEEWIQLPSPEH